MNYETAKKLKEAKFPTPCGQTYCDDCTFYNEGLLEGVGCPEGFIHVPTLEELIEECGEGIFNLLRQSEWHTQQSGFSWEAKLARPQDMKIFTVQEVEKITHTTYGNSPEEAVANLYLALHPSE